MKTVTIDYDEYIKQIELIKKQSDIIDELKKGDNIVLIDYRRGCSHEFRLPYIGEIFSYLPHIVSGENLVNAEIKKEIDYFGGRVKHILDEYRDASIGKRDMPPISKEKENFFKKYFRW